MTTTTQAPSERLTELLMTVPGPAIAHLFGWASMPAPRAHCPKLSAWLRDAAENEAARRELRSAPEAVLNHRDWTDEELIDALAQITILLTSTIDPLQERFAHTVQIVLLAAVGYRLRRKGGNV